MALTMVMALAPAALAQAAVPGSLDGSYGNCGVLPAPRTAQEAVPAGALPVPGGGLVAVGTDRDTLVTVRLGAGGQVDAAYGSGGVTQAKLGGFTAPSYRFAAVATQSGGRIVAAGAGGERNTSTARAVLARLNADGSLDPTFGAAGVVTDALPGGTQSTIEAVDVDSAERILVAGRRDDAFVVARFTPDGAPDQGFGTAGVAQVALPGFKSGAGTAIKALPGGGAVAGGAADEQFALVRLRADGTPDPGFGTAGATFDSPPASSGIRALALLPDGRIVAGGFGDDINGQHQVVGRFTADGHADPTFGRGGFVLNGDVGTADAIFPSPDTGSLFVVGGGFARYTASGALDPTFGVRGVFPASPPGFVVPQPDGSVLGVAGRRQPMAFERYAVADPALGGLAQQSPLCGVTIETRRVKQLIRAGDESPFGGVDVGLTLVEPTSATWTMTARAGGRTYKFRTPRLKFDAAFPEGFVIPLTKRVHQRLARARSVQVTVTGRDSAGHVVTAERTLRP